MWNLVLLINRPRKYFAAKCYSKIIMIRTFLYYGQNFFKNDSPAITTVNFKFRCKEHVQKRSKLKSRYIWNYAIFNSDISSSTYIYWSKNNVRETEIGTTIRVKVKCSICQYFFLLYLLFIPITGCCFIIVLILCKRRRRKRRVSSASVRNILVQPEICKPSN